MIIIIMKINQCIYSVMSTIFFLIIINCLELVKLDEKLQLNMYIWINVNAGDDGEIILIITEQKNNSCYYCHDDRGMQ